MLPPFYYGQNHNNRKNPLLKQRVLRNGYFKKKRGRKEVLWIGIAAAHGLRRFSYC